MGVDIWLKYHAAEDSERTFDVFDCNITHNLSPMWQSAGVWECIYKSDGKRAEEIIPALEKGVADMRARPALYEQLNSPNGWGTYKNAMPWLEGLLSACKQHPKATIGVSA